MVFKEVIEKPKKVNLDACKLITEQTTSCLSWSTIFSVRVREKCPDYYRGFVHVEFEDLQLERVELAPIKGTCHVIGCSKRSITAKIAKGEEICHHVAACITRSDFTEAEPFTLKHSVLNSMSISTDCKQKIFLKARNGDPLVQRVSSTTMVVKCDKDEVLNPLGYLHTSFINQNGTSKFGCSCSLSVPSKKRSSSIIQGNSMMRVL